MRLDEIKKLHPWQLARMGKVNNATISGHFTPHSPAAEILVKVCDSFVEEVEAGTAFKNLPVNVMINRALPVSTAKQWEAFVELGLYSFAFEDDGDEPFTLDSMSELAYLVLFQVGERLIDALMDEWQPDDPYGEPEVTAERIGDNTRWVVVLDGKRIVVGAASAAEARKMADNWLKFFPKRPADWAEYTDDLR